MTLGPAQVRALAAELELRPTKRLGQNFVIDPNTVRRIVKVAEVRATDVVLEIGPGLGSLTVVLLAQAAEVIAVEIDERLGAVLARTVAAHVPEGVDRLRVMVADAMDVVRFAEPLPTALVANLPYNVSVPVVLHVLEHFPSIERALIMVQAEVADRMCAEPGSRIYGVPSAKVAWYAAAHRAGSVSRRVFWPEPNVDSALVALTRRPAPLGDRVETFAVIDAAFAQRRKTLRAALAHWAGSPDAAAAACVEAGVDPGARGEALFVGDFSRLAAARPPAQRI